MKDTTQAYLIDLLDHKLEAMTDPNEMMLELIKLEGFDDPVLNDRMPMYNEWYKECCQETFHSKDTKHENNDGHSN